MFVGVPDVPVSSHDLRLLEWIAAPLCQSVLGMIATIIIIWLK